MPNQLSSYNFAKSLFCWLILCSTTFTAQTPTVGLIQHNVGSLDNGYVLFAPVRDDTTYLIDKCGNKIHQWVSNRTPGLSAYLLSDGSILRSEALPNTVFNYVGSVGGKIKKIEWNGNIVWSYTISTTAETQNHDIFPMPNGNVLVAVWTNKSVAQAISAGRDTSILGTSIWSAKIVELQPVGTNSANIVWQWDLWDHLIQDLDNTKNNYGVVADHPELLNINFNGNNSAKGQDWVHLNAVTYDSTLDQIMFSSHMLSEIYIIDHNTTTAEAASHTGGKHGKGGDFLYRWGNPQAYNRGTSSDRTLFLQHNPTWIPKGFKDEKKIMIFNNGNNRPGGNASSVEIISPPITTSGDYTISAGQAYNPSVAEWTYMDPVPTNFFAWSMGSAQRLSNGNTLIDEANQGRFFEIDSLKNIVWEYVNPVSATGPVSQGSTNATPGVFRSVFYSSSYQAFSGKNLSAGNPIELNPYPSTCNFTTGKTIVNTNQGISLFPNPTTNYFAVTVRDDHQIKLIEITNSLGQNILNSNNSIIDISQLSDGLYFIKVTTNDHQVFVEKLIKH